MRRHSSSSRPLSSPTAIIWSARGGNVPASAGASALPSVRAADARSTPSCITRLVAEARAILSDGRAGTPLFNSRPNVRANRAVEYLSSISPIQGHVSRAACQRRRVSGRVRAVGTRYAAAAASSNHAHQPRDGARSEEHTSELQSLAYLVCRLLLEKKKEHYVQQRKQDKFQSHGTH